MSTCDMERSGWDALTKAYQALYPDDDNPRQYNALVHYDAGGLDPLNMVSVYDGGDFWHFVSYGLTEIFEKVTEYKDVSGYGYELNMRLAKKGAESEEVITSVAGLMQAVARLTYRDARIFREGDLVRLGELDHINTGLFTNIKAFLITGDPDLDAIDTVNGSVKFLTLTGLDKDRLNDWYDGHPDISATRYITMLEP